MDKYARLVDKIQGVLSDKKYVDAIWIKFTPKMDSLVVDVVIDGSYSSVPKEICNLEIQEEEVMDTVDYAFYFEKRYVMGDGKVCIYNKVNGKRKQYAIFSELYKIFYSGYQIYKEATVKVDIIRREVFKK